MLYREINLTFPITFPGFIWIPGTRHIFSYIALMFYLIQPIWVTKTVVFDFIAIWVIHLFKKYLKLLLHKYQRLPNDWIIQLWTIFLYELKLYSHYCLFTILLLSPLLSKATNSLKAWLCIDFTTVCLLSCLTTPLTMVKSLLYAASWVLLLDSHTSIFS